MVWPKVPRTDVQHLLGTAQDERGVRFRGRKEHIGK